MSIVHCCFLSSFFLAFASINGASIFTSWSCIHFISRRSIARRERKLLTCLRSSEEEEMEKVNSELVLQNCYITEQSQRLKKAAELPHKERQRLLSELKAQLLSKQQRHAAVHGHGGGGGDDDKLTGGSSSAAGGSGSSN